MSEERRPAGPEGVGSLRLGPERPSVTRLSRRVLAGLGAVAAVTLIGLGWWSLEPGQKSAAKELYATGGHNIAEGLQDLPRDYSGVPRPVPPLGPPLPGDLGRPILNAEARGQMSPGSDMAAQRLGQERDAALASGLFVRTASASIAGGAEAALAGVETAGASNVSPSSDPGATQSLQDQKLAFLNGPADRATLSLDRLVAPASPYILQAGSVIPAALITGIRSDLPGEITAQVTEDVYDSPTGQILLVPQGSKLIGRYDSEIAFAQRRVQMVWNRLILPDGESIVLTRQPGADAQGYSGLEDQVDNHWGTLFKSALLSTFLSVGAEAGTTGEANNLSEAIRGGAANSVSQIGQQIVERNLNVQPTLTIRPGFPLRVMVDRDLVLSPYQQ